jgi:chloramphenicol-sensitive protein RarD
MYKGMACTVSSSVLWGFLPLYLKVLAPLPALEVLAHRIVWAFLCAGLILLCRREVQWLVLALRCPRTVGILAASAALIALNWLLYLWAVSTNHVVEASLGYFIAPLITILFGALFLQESLQARHKLAMSVAGVGIVYLALGMGSAPWLGLTLGAASASYTLLKKRAALEPATGLALEMMLLLLPALLYLGYLAESGQGSLGHSGPTMMLQLGGSGMLTALPLLLYATGVRRLPLTTLGFFQYLTPSVQLLIGVFLLHESFPAARLIGFSLVWLALVVYLASPTGLALCLRRGRIV